MRPDEPEPPAGFISLEADECRRDGCGNDPDAPFFNYCSSVCRSVALQQAARKVFGGPRHIKGCDSHWRGAFGDLVEPPCPTCKAIEDIESSRIYEWDDLAAVERLHAAPGWSRMERERGPRP